MQVTSLTIVFLLLSCCLWEVESQNDTSILTVENGRNRGKWGNVTMCPPESKAKGFSLKVQPKQGLFSDDTSLNGIRLICSDDSVITSAVGKDGTWSYKLECESGFLNSFLLRVTERKILQDNTSANNIKFKCTDGSELEGHGRAEGDYGSWSESCNDGICGIKTRVDNPKRLILLDKTGLNDVQFFCCT